MRTKQRAERAPSAVEQREFQRNIVDLPGNLIVPAEDISMPCQVLNLSGGGASIRCEDPPPLHTYVILWIGGFGRLEAVTQRFVDGELGLQFVIKEPKRQRLLSDIQNHIKSGMAGTPNLRRHARMPSISKVRITLAGGEELSCEVINVSTRGLSLRTGARPPVDNFVSIGGKYARVVRHHGEGVAVEFSENYGRPIP
jgi:hypothetical protein